MTKKQHKLKLKTKPRPLPLNEMISMMECHYQEDSPIMGISTDPRSC